MHDNVYRREIRSFVRREGRLTPGQQKALDAHWATWGIDEVGQQLDLPGLFGRDNPKVLEIGFGNGASLAQMAAAQPDFDFIGVEVHRPGVGQLLKSIHELDLSNVRVACMDAVVLLRERIADAALQRVQLYFPDPWHKKRHHKRRIIQPDFIRLISSKLSPEGQIHLATDWQDYAEQMLQDLGASPNFKNLGNDDGFIPRPDYRPITKFEQRGHRLGHGVWDLLFEKCN
ncbi:tRNA (guanine46-N7-)-methyltransferase [Methylophaga frappieri]|uniref:tRNA (guanine-N(7)-)-methyltransferase n=1 Tax=Methylophaga frappieri (strain ATCC BAA-2434 / DSM 25690 / JAM7) TaxID=754477 RepID=I1YL61_METFJ|nr:tRNA (guanosine(46)-N7)-methyltransferase TrmB [Methylophaga frappieri]AFJ03654.1 tRNA (guanine46-N7-)-methyltransferase [Methylophaga frappieri]